MSTSKYLQIDGQEYQVAVVEMQRKGDVLDLTANRTEDGVLHREVIGTFYNYTLGIIEPNNPLTISNISVNELVIVSASFVTLLIISPLDFSSKATEGKLRTLLYVSKLILFITYILILLNM